MNTIIKRNGKLVPYDLSKIKIAITKANLQTDQRLQMTENDINLTLTEINKDIQKYDGPLSVEEIQDIVEEQIIAAGAVEVARNYIKYRYIHQLARDSYSDFMNAIGEKLEAKDIKNQNANVDEHSFGGRMGEAGDVMAKRYALENCMSEKSKNNHLNNRIYIHDLNSYAVGSHNCLSIPFDKILAEGFNTRQTDVRPAQSVSTAFQLIAVVFQLQSLQQFGRLNTAC